MNKSVRAIFSLSWQSIAYGVGILGSQFVIYLMLPFLTRYMSREEYGVVSVMIAIYTFMNTLTNAGLPAATYRFYDKTKTEQDREATLGGSQFLFFTFASIPALGILIFPRFVSGLLLGSEQYALPLQVVACFLIFNTMNAFGTIILRIETRALVSSIHSILLMITKTGLALLFVTRYEMGILGYWLGYMIGEFMGLLFMIWLVRKKIVFMISWERIWELVKFGLPLMPATLSTTILKLADRYIIGSLAGLDQVAVYDVGYKVGTMILVLIMPFRVAWMPFSFSIAHKPEAPRIYKNVLTYLMAGCSFLLLGVYAFRSELIHIMAPASYEGARNVVGWVSAAQLFYAAYLVFSIGPMIKKKTQDLGWIALIASGTNLLLNFILIPMIGILGAAIATLVGYGLLATFAFLAARRSFDMRIDWKRMRQLALTIGLVIIAILMVERFDTGLWMEIALKILALLIFPILLVLTGFSNLNQARQLLNMGRELIGKRFASNKTGGKNGSKNESDQNEISAEIEEII